MKWWKSSVLPATQRGTDLQWSLRSLDEIANRPRVAKHMFWPQRKTMTALCQVLTCMALKGVKGEMQTQWGMNRGLEGGAGTYGDGLLCPFRPAQHACFSLGWSLHIVDTQGGGGVPRHPRSSPADNNGPHSGSTTHLASSDQWFLKEDTHFTRSSIQPMCPNTSMSNNLLYSLYWGWFTSSSLISITVHVCHPLCLDGPLVYCRITQSSLLNLSSTSDIHRHSPPSKQHS